MRRKLAHLLRRGARVMIRQSNKLDPPHHDHVHTAMGRTTPPWLTYAERTDGFRSF